MQPSCWQDGWRLFTNKFYSAGTVNVIVTRVPGCFSPPRHHILLFLSISFLAPLLLHVAAAAAAFRIQFVDGE
jgi:hypothetical protein